ncbi:P-loop containing nucleoside triphosphate hydrolase protein [Hyaloraphidium curvatum]|nr:P-loop containing nucleoside triphosphate hydrolase protein [Hyaloraphidium curvatum]
MALEQQVATEVALELPAVPQPKKRRPGKAAPLVVSGPSGGGKSTLLTRLFKSYDGAFGLSVSHTTRKPRPGEENGRHYWFVTRDEFLALKADGGFVETAEFAGNLYGTSIKAIKDVQNEGRICVLDVESNGVKSIKNTDLGAKYLFIMPPNFETLERRLRGRQTETEEAIQKRLATAQTEIDYAKQDGVYDTIIVNDDLETAYKSLLEFVEETWFDC